MQECRLCGYLYDPGELQGFVCDDCREAERQLEIRKEWNRKMRARHITEQADGQLVLCRQ